MLLLYILYILLYSTMQYIQYPCIMYFIYIICSGVFRGPGGRTPSPELFQSPPEHYHRLILLNSKEKIRTGELSILVNIARSFRVGIVCVIS